MNSTDTLCRTCCGTEHLLESRTQRFNLPVTHPPKWQFFRELFFSSPNHIYRYRQLSKRMLEHTIRTLNRGDCK